MSEIKKLTEDDLEIIAQEINSALAPIAKRHGLKLSCFGEYLQSGGMSATLSVDAEVICPPACSKKAQEFAFFLAANKLDTQYGLSWEDYGKEFTFNGMTFRVIGAHGIGSAAYSITVEHNGYLYQLQPAFVAEAIRGTAKSICANDLRKHMKAQEVLTKVPTAEANNYASLRKWEWAVNHLPKYPFEMLDYDTTISLYGKDYTIVGFFDVRPYQSVLVCDNQNLYHKVPAYKVLHALGRLEV